jgi:folate-binding protein YgfZ
MRFGRPGWDLWWPVTPACAAPAFPAEVPILTPDEVETWRILAGIPRWPLELHGEVFPPEAGLQSRAMDYAKGCYIGQEVLSRIKTTGKMPQTLVKVLAKDEPPVLKPGGVLFKSLGDGSQVKAGQITSVSLDPLTGREAGLAYVKQSFATEHSLLLATADLPNITFEVEIILP